MGSRVGGRVGGGFFGGGRDPRIRGEIEELLLIIIGVGNVFSTTSLCVSIFVCSLNCTQYTWEMTSLKKYAADHTDVRFPLSRSADKSILAVVKLKF